MIKRFKRWLSNQTDFLKEFSSFCIVSALVILAVFGPMVLAGGVFKRPGYLLLYIPMIAIALEINENY
jgi:hypothetical protein